MTTQTITNPTRAARVPLTARQRAELARLRVTHPRARVTVMRRASQTHLPLVKVRLTWRRPKGARYARTATVWLGPDGSRLTSGRGLGLFVSGVAR